MAISAATIAVIGIASAGIQAYGQMKEGEARAQAESFNADVARQQANLIRTRGRLDVMRQRKAAIAFSSTQQALYAKSGVALTGSPLQVMEESAANAELDILITEFNTATGAAGAESQAREKDRLARAERKMGYTRAGKTLLSAIGSAALMSGVGSAGTTASSGRVIRSVRNAESSRSIGSIESMFR